jgi:hypothetical protein
MNKLLEIFAKYSLKKEFDTNNYAEKKYFEDVF